MNGIAGRIAGFATAVTAVVGASLVSAVPAHADGFAVGATAKVSPSTLKVGASSTGKGTQTFSARVANVPLPQLGYYKNSFPTSFKKPSLAGSNVGLVSKEYKKNTNDFLGKTQWEVWGKQWFLGDLSAVITGRSVAETAGTGTKFYVGTDECLKEWPSCHMAQDTVSFTIKKK